MKTPVQRTPSTRIGVKRQSSKQSEGRPVGPTAPACDLTGISLDARPVRRILGPDEKRIRVLRMREGAVAPKGYSLRNPPALAGGVLFEQPGEKSKDG
jgi:hypothetical protein